MNREVVGSIPAVVVFVGMIRNISAMLKRTIFTLNRSFLASSIFLCLICLHFLNNFFSVDLNPPGEDLIRVHLKHILDGSANFKIQQMLWLIFGQLLQIFWAF